MLALNNLSNFEREKTTKILKPWWNVISDYLIIFLLTVPIIVGGMVLVSGKITCLPAVDCSLSKNGRLLSEIKYYNACSAFYSSRKSTDAGGKATTVVTELKKLPDYVNSECSKTILHSFQSYFSLILFGQAFILLLTNNLWLKFPSTASIVHRFYALAVECNNLPGEQVAKLTTAQKKDVTVRVTTVSQHNEQEPSSAELEELLPLTALSDSEEEIFDFVGVDDVTAVADKTLYEKIRRFNDYVKTSQQIQNVYLLQAVLQVLLTVTFFVINLAFTKDLKGTMKCSIDEYIPVVYDYFTCSHNLTAVFETASVLFLIVLGVFSLVCVGIAIWTINKAFCVGKYHFKIELNHWRRPSDLTQAEADMGFLLHLLHAYNELYTVQFVTYMSEEHNKKYKTMILDKEWPMEKLERYITKDDAGYPKELFLWGLSGLPSSLFRLGSNTATRLKELKINRCGPLQGDDDLYRLDTLIQRFPHLTVLTLHKCGLTKIPEALLNLSLLEHLCLRKNSIKEIQGGISRLERLSTFDISYNKLTTIDESIGTLSRIHTVDISNNPNIPIPAIKNVLACGGLSKLGISNLRKFSPQLSQEDREKLKKVTCEET